MDQKFKFGSVSAFYILKTLKLKKILIIIFLTNVVGVGVRGQKFGIKLIGIILITTNI